MQIMSRSAFVSLAFDLPPDAWATAWISAGTDNRGNSFTIKRSSGTTKYPLVAVLMELAAQLQLRSCLLHAHGVPRLQNKLARRTQ